MVDLVKYKSIICREASSLSDDDKKNVRNIIQRNSFKQIKQFKDGIRIDLDKLSDETVIEVYNFMKYKLGLDE